MIGKTLSEPLPRACRLHRQNSRSRRGKKVAWRNTGLTNGRRDTPLPVTLPAAAVAKTTRSWGVMGEPAAPDGRFGDHQIVDCQFRRGSGNGNLRPTPAGGRADGRKDPLGKYEQHLATGQAADGQGCIRFAVPGAGTITQKTALPGATGKSGLPPSVRRAAG